MHNNGTGNSPEFLSHILLLPLTCADCCLTPADQLGGCTISWKLCWSARLSSLAYLALILARNLWNSWHMCAHFNLCTKRVSICSRLASICSRSFWRNINPSPDARSSISPQRISSWRASSCLEDRRSARLPAGHNKRFNIVNRKMQDTARLGYLYAVCGIGQRMRLRLLSAQRKLSFSVRRTQLNPSALQP